MGREYLGRTMVEGKNPGVCDHCSGRALEAIERLQRSFICAPAKNLHNRRLFDDGGGVEKSRTSLGKVRLRKVSLVPELPGSIRRSLVLTLGDDGRWLRC